MNDFQEIKPEQIDQNTFQLIGTDWMLVTAKNAEKLNTMTASWGGFGVMWGRNVAYIVLRPQRYTKEILDTGDTFSLTFFESNYKKQLSYLGSVSGRDEDKVKNCGLTVVSESETPYFAEGKLVLQCKKLFAQPFHPDNFLDHDLKETWYPDKDYHTLYIAEICKVLTR